MDNCVLATAEDISCIDRLYSKRNIYFGDLHNHSDSGGTSDGKCTLSQWKTDLKALDMDFVAILDHRQVRHMYLDEWEDGTFIRGTEPGTRILNTICPCTDGKNGLHYNMLVPFPSVLEELLAEFPEFEFEGGPEGHFAYPRFTRERFTELIDALKRKNGFFVIPHPKQIMLSEEPLDYYFCDGVGIEVFYIDMRSDSTKENYELWKKLLALGKRVWACSGEDGHAFANDTALTAIYSEEKSSPSFLPHLASGDFVCGSVAIRMCIGDTLMGGSCDFSDKRVVVAVDRFHRSVAVPEHQYRLDVITDKGTVYSQNISCVDKTYVAFDADMCSFYRVEIFDETDGLRIAIGNPIWNDN